MKIVKLNGGHPADYQDWPLRELRQRVKAAQDQNKGRPRKNKKSAKKKVAKKVAKKKVETKEMATETEPIDDAELNRQIEEVLSESKQE